MDSQPTIVLANNFNFRRGGAEAMLFQQEEMLQERGFGTAIICAQHPNNRNSDWSDYFVPATAWDEPDVDVSLVDATRAINNSAAYKSTRRLIADTDASLMHAHNVYHHLSPSVLKAAKDAGIPVVMTVHDYKLLCPAYSMLRQQKICEDCQSNRVYNAIRGRCMQQSIGKSVLVAIESGWHRFNASYLGQVDRFLSPSQFVIDKFVEWGWPQSKFELLPNAVNPAGFPLNAQVGERFLFAGRLAEEKGVSMLISAAAKADVALDIVGTGPLEERLRQQAASTGQDIQFHGYQSGDDLHELIARCRALVLPSQWYENAPVSVLEAYACGRPVVVARIGGMPEMVLHGQTGLIFEFGQVESLIQSLRQLRTMPDESLIEMGHEARQRVETRYSLAAQTKQLLNIYRQLGVDIPGSADWRPDGMTEYVELQESST